MTGWESKEVKAVKKVKKAGMDVTTGAGHLWQESEKGKEGKRLEKAKAERWLEAFREISKSKQ